MVETYQERLLAQHMVPSEEPVSLAEAKLYLRVDGSADDTLISEMIVAARQAAEHFLRRSLVTQQWRLVVNDALPTELRLPMGKVQQIMSVTTYDESAIPTTVSTGQYELNAAQTALLSDGLICGHQVEVIYEAGYGDAVDIPIPIKHGVLAHISELYDGRSRAMPISDCIRAMYQPFREVLL